MTGPQGLAHGSMPLRARLGLIGVKHNDHLGNLPRRLWPARQGFPQ